MDGTGAGPRASDADRFVTVVAVRDGRHVDDASRVAARMAAAGDVPLTIFDAARTPEAFGVPDGTHRIAMSADRLGSAVAAAVAGRDGVLVVVDAYGGGPPADALFDRDAEQLLRGRQPVLVIGPQAARPAWPWRLIVPIDGSPECGATPPVVIRWRNTFGATPVTVVALDAPDPWPRDGTEPVSDPARTTVALLARATIDAALVRRMAPDPVTGVLGALDGDRSAVLVVPAPASARMSHWWSTVRRLVRHAPCPVLAVPVSS